MLDISGNKARSSEVTAQGVFKSMVPVFGPANIGFTDAHNVDVLLLEVVSEGFEMSPVTVRTKTVYVLMG